MAGTLHSVFAPYTPGSGTQRCEHQHPFTLSSPPPQLVKRPTTPRPDIEDPSTRRTKIWEFSQNLHCSIIGTCLSTGELRQTLAKLGLAQPDWTDHDLHHKAVSLAAGTIRPRDFCTKRSIEGTNCRSASSVRPRPRPS